MRIITEAIEFTGPLAELAASIRKEVFEQEWNYKLAPPSHPMSGQRIDLIARVERSGEPVAVLTVVDTTGDAALHERFGLPFSTQDRTARYTQLAVLKPYRGLDIPLKLITEGQRLFVTPGGFEHTWLLFNAERAASSSLCRCLGFQAGGRTYASEYGRVRVLARDERQTAMPLDGCLIPQADGLQIGQAAF
jgi:hypothetical protein